MQSERVEPRGNIDNLRGAHGVRHRVDPPVDRVALGLERAPRRGGELDGDHGIIAAVREQDWDRCIGRTLFRGKRRRQRQISRKREQSRETARLA